MLTTLVSTAELAANPHWRIFDCRHDLARPALGEEQYRDAHIPGALFAHLDRDLSATKTGRNGRHPLPDPNPNMSVEQVREMYIPTHPEITTAAVTGPEAIDGKLRYTFSRAIGHKG